MKKNIKGQTLYILIIIRYFIILFSLLLIGFSLNRIDDEVGKRRRVCGSKKTYHYNKNKNHKEDSPKYLNFKIS